MTSIPQLRAPSCSSFCFLQHTVTKICYPNTTRPNTAGKYSEAYLLCAMLAVIYFCDHCRRFPLSRPPATPFARWGVCLFRLVARPDLNLISPEFLGLDTHTVSCLNEACRSAPCASSLLAFAHFVSVSVSSKQAPAFLMSTFDAGANFASKEATLDSKRDVSLWIFELGNLLQFRPSMDSTHLPPFKPLDLLGMRWGEVAREAFLALPRTASRTTCLQSQGSVRRTDKI